MSLEWVLLEHVVRAETWLRFEGDGALQPMTAFLLLALVSLLILAVLEAGRRARRSILALGSRAAAPRPAAAAAVGHRPPAPYLVPVGAQGARAPGRS